MICYHLYYILFELQYTIAAVYCYFSLFHRLLIKKRGHSHPTQSNPIQSMDGSNPCPTLGLRTQNCCSSLHWILLGLDGSEMMFRVVKR